MGAFVFVLMLLIRTFSRRLMPDHGSGVSLHWARAWFARITGESKWIPPPPPKLQFRDCSLYQIVM